MLKLFNDHYYFDLEEINKYVNLDVKDTSGSTEQHISVVRYELVKMMIETIITEREDIDETLGEKSSTSIPFKIAFNTLLNNKIIQKY
jgi:hypothetical protein